MTSANSDQELVALITSKAGVVLWNADYDKAGYLTSSEIRYLPHLEELNLDGNPCNL